jgi:hypothetical protein
MIMAYSTSDNLAAYEVYRPLLEPLLRAFRLTNTVCDVLFYDVHAFTMKLLSRSKRAAARGSPSSAGLGGAPEALRHFNFDALTNPEGTILIVDATAPPYISKYHDIRAFLKAVNGGNSAAMVNQVRTVTVTGVGSSALGSAAFAWNVSEALTEPVAAIVPGYGLADIVPQALGGWFGFVLHDDIQSATQNMLAAFMPGLAQVGRNLVASSPEGEKSPLTGAPVFRHGSAESDILHAILRSARRIRRVVGHSKGALGIENAIRSLGPQRQKELVVLTFGCAVAEEQAGSRYDQFLGVVDPLGILNSWFHPPEQWLFGHHSTNTMIPFSMPITSLTRSASLASR